MDFHERMARLRAAIEARKSLEKDAERYRWLRDGNAYVPEECGATGGDFLDGIVDCGIREDKAKEAHR